MASRRTPAILDKNTKKQQFILIIEDDPEIGFVLLTALRDTAYAAQLVPDGETALRLVATHTPHLVIVDYMLPGISGLDVADHIRSMHGLEHVPLLMVSSNLPKAELAQRHLSGLNKPFDIETLLTVIEQLLSAHAWTRC
jgi:DNA-binding response OmpR family regulator